MRDGQEFFGGRTMDGRKEFLLGGDPRERIEYSPPRDRLAAVGECLRGAYPAADDGEIARLLALFGTRAPDRGDDNHG